MLAIREIKKIKIQELVKVRVKKESYIKRFDLYVPLRSFELLIGKLLIFLLQTYTHLLSIISL